MKDNFVIIANPRTGTNHFIDLLNSHPDISCHRELFHKHSVYMLEGTRDDLLEIRNQDPMSFLKQIYNRDKNRSCGFKIFMDHNEEILNNVLYDRDIKKIILYRPNYLAVYSSDLIASAEKMYLIADEKPMDINTQDFDKSFTKKKAFFDRKTFELRLHKYNEYYCHAVNVMNETCQDYLFVTYEDFINEFLFRRVFNFLGLCQPLKVQTRMKKMNSSYILSRFENADTVRGYLEETGRLDWAYEGFMTW